MLFLGDRILLEDGRTLIEPEQVERFLSKGIKPANLLVTELTAEVVRFNRLSVEKIACFSEAPQPAELEWIIPDAYKYLDVEDYLFKLAAKAFKADDPLMVQREQRVVEELMLFESHCMLPLLRTLIFIVDRMKAQRVVWGVGRGSSCSSYLLYLIGLHNVDPVKYDVSIRDFIRDED